MRQEISLELPHVGNATVAAAFFTRSYICMYSIHRVIYSCRNGLSGKTFSRENGIRQWEDMSIWEKTWTRRSYVR